MNSDPLTARVLLFLGIALGIGTGFWVYALHRAARALRRVRDDERILRRAREAQKARLRVMQAFERGERLKP